MCQKGYLGPIWSKRVAGVTVPPPFDKLSLSLVKYYMGWFISNDFKK